MLDHVELLKYAFQIQDKSGKMGQLRFVKKISVTDCAKTLGNKEKWRRKKKQIKQRSPSMLYQDFEFLKIFFSHTYFIFEFWRNVFSEFRTTFGLSGISFYNFLFCRNVFSEFMIIVPDREFVVVDIHFSLIREDLFRRWLIRQFLCITSVRDLFTDLLD